MWDFSTEPEYQDKLDWARAFVREQVRPLEVLGVDRDTLTVLEEPLKQQVKDAGLWAAHLPPELGGGGMGQLKLALLHEILGQAFYASEVFGNMAPGLGERRADRRRRRRRAEAAMAVPAARRASCGVRSR